LAKQFLIEHLLRDAEAHERENYVAIGQGGRNLPNFQPCADEE